MLPRQVMGRVSWTLAMQRRGHQYCRIMYLYIITDLHGLDKLSLMHFIAA